MKKDKKQEPLTRYQQTLLAALKDAGPQGVSVERMDTLKPEPVVPKKNLSNRFAVHMKEIRRKTGLKIVAIRGYGYKIEHE